MTSPHDLVMVAAVFLPRLVAFFQEFFHHAFGPPGRQQPVVCINIDLDFLPLPLGAKADHQLLEVFGLYFPVAPRDSEPTSRTFHDRQDFPVRQ